MIPAGVRRLKELSREDLAAFVKENASVLTEEEALAIANPIAPQCVRIAGGGEVLEIIDTGAPCYACMLGGDDGRTLFMLTAASSDHEAAASARTGKIVVTEADSPRAGRP